MADGKQNFYPIVDVTDLRKCKLWEGSEFESSFKFAGGVSLAALQIRYERLSKCDDLTQSEREWLKAMKATIDDPAGFRFVK